MVALSLMRVVNGACGVRNLGYGEDLARSNVLVGECRKESERNGYSGETVWR